MAEHGHKHEKASVVTEIQKVFGDEDFLPTEVVYKKCQQLNKVDGFLLRVREYLKNWNVKVDHQVDAFQKLLNEAGWYKSSDPVGWVKK